MQLAVRNVGLKAEISQPETVVPPCMKRDVRRRPVSLGEYVDQNGQKSSIVSVFGRTLTGSSVNEYCDPRRRRTLYVHCKPTLTTMVVAEVLQMDAVNGGINGHYKARTQLTSTSRLQALPMNHCGWYELLSADGHSATPITTVDRLLKLGVGKFLVRQPIVADVVPRVDVGNAVDNGHIRVQVAVGEIITILGCDDCRPGERQGRNPSRSSQSGRVRCLVDRTGVEVEISIDLHGLFTPVAGLTAVTGIHRVQTIVEKFRLPVVVRLVSHSGVDGSATSGEIGLGTILRLLSVNVEPAVYVVPLSSPLAPSFDVVYVVAKRAAGVFVEQLTMTEDIDERRNGRPSRQDVSTAIIDQLGQRCDQLIDNCRTLSVVCRLLQRSSGKNEPAHSRSFAEDHRQFHYDNLPIGSRSIGVQRRHVRVGRQSSVDSGTSSLTGVGLVADTGCVSGTTDGSSCLTDVTENRLMDEIDAIYDAIKGIDSSQPHHHYHHQLVTQRSDPRSDRGHHVSATEPTAAERQVEVNNGGTTKHRRKMTSVEAAATRCGRSNVKRRSLALDSNFVIVGPQRPSRSNSQPPQTVKLHHHQQQLIGKMTTSKTTSKPEINGLNEPVKSPRRHRNSELVNGNNSIIDDNTIVDYATGQSNNLNHHSIGFNSSGFGDDIPPETKQTNVDQYKNATGNIYECLANTAAVVSPKTTDNPYSMHSLGRSQRPINRRPQSFAGTSTASLQNMFDSQMTDGAINQPRLQHSKRHLFNSQHITPPPLPPDRHSPTQHRPRNGGVRPTSGGEPIDFNGCHSTPPPPPLPQFKSSPSLGGALGALSRSFFSTVRRVGGNRMATSKTLVLNHGTNSRDGAAVDPASRAGGQRETAGNKAKMWWNASHLRNANDRSSDFLVDAKMFPMQSSKRFSYAEPPSCSRDYDVTLLAKRF